MGALFMKRSLIITAITTGIFLYVMPLHAQEKTTDTKASTPETEQYPLPKGWHKSGTAPSKFVMGMVKGAGQKGTNAATIKSLGNVKGTGTLMQSFDPQKYLGKKVRLIGYIRSEHVAEWAGLWMRIDDSTKKSLAFDDMINRPIKGTTEWTRCEIVMEVPQNAANISYGALLHGAGQIWFDNLSFEIVKPAPQVEARLKEPTNLDFEK